MAANIQLDADVPLPLADPVTSLKPQRRRDYMDSPVYMRLCVWSDIGGGEHALLHLFVHCWMNDGDSVWRFLLSEPGLDPNVEGTYGEVIAVIRNYIAGRKLCAFDSNINIVRKEPTNATLDDLKRQTNDATAILFTSVCATGQLDEKLMTRALLQLMAETGAIWSLE